MDALRKFYYEEDGMGTIEIVMIIAALMCVALLFREQLFTFVGNIISTVFDTGTISTPSANG